MLELQAKIRAACLCQLISRKRQSGKRSNNILISSACLRPALRQKRSSRNNKRGGKGESGSQFFQVGHVFLR